MTQSQNTDILATSLSLPDERKWEAGDVTDDLRLQVEDWLLEQQPTFEFLVDMKAELKSKGQLSPGQAKGVWNCVRADALRQRTQAPKLPGKVHNVKPIDQDGFYYLERDGEVTIYKVQVAHHGSGNLYAKRLALPDVEAGETKGEWVYEGRKPLYEPLEKLTLEKARELGHLYGVCMKCGATLTDERSIEAGIGPVCAKSGW